MKTIGFVLILIISILSCNDHGTTDPWGWPAFFTGSVIDSVSSTGIAVAWVSRDSIYDIGRDSLTDSAGNYIIFGGWAGQNVDIFCGKEGYLTQSKKVYARRDTVRVDFRLVKK